MPASFTVTFRFKDDPPGVERHCEALTTSCARAEQIVRACLAQPIEIVSMTGKYGPAFNASHAHACRAYEAAGGAA